MNKQVEIETPKGLGQIEKIYVSELNYLMMQVYYQKEGVWVTYNLGQHKPDSNMFTEKMKVSQRSTLEKIN